MAPQRPTVIEGVGEIDLTRQRLRVAATNALYLYMSSVELTADSIIQATTDPEVRYNALVWKTNAIVRIDPHDGVVTGVLDLSGIIEPHPVSSDSAAVLNGIAYDAEADTFLVTGKRWPELIEIRLLD